VGLLEQLKVGLNGLLDRVAQQELADRRSEDLELELQRRRSQQNAQEHERDRRIAMEEAAKARGKKNGVVAVAAGRAHRLRVLYAQLGMPAGSSLEQCKHAYRTLMRQHHPDQGGDASRATELSVAWEELQQLLA
jgi:DnaJ-domain-containing protein 1